MGNCESCNRPNKSSNSYPNNAQTQIYNNKIGELNTYLNNKENKIKQNIIAGEALPISSGKEEEINNQMKNSVCKIYANDKYGTGFLCKIPFPDQYHYLPVLIANKSLINEDYLLNKRKIDIIFDNDKEERTINIIHGRKIYNCKNYDIIFIEIFPKEDEINDIQFLEIYMQMPRDIIYDINDINNKIDNSNNIYIIQYIDEKSCIKSYGIIKNIHEDIIEHNCSTKNGGPILLIKNMKLIGINKINGQGILLYEPIKEFNLYMANINKKKSPINYIDCYYIIEKEEEFNLLHDYNNTINKYVQRLKDIDGKDKKKFIEGNINIYIDSQLIGFNYKYKTNKKKIHVKFIFKEILNDLSFMFFNCQNLEKVDFSSYDMTNITDMKCIFSGCSNLKIVDLSTLRTNNYISLGNVFSGCLSLKIVDFPLTYRSINITDLDRTFFSCSSLESINLLSFNTIKVEDMDRLFSGCNSLKTVDLSSFQTNNAKLMSLMFAFCTNLKSVNLSNFDTRNVESMNDMFFDCRALLTLDLSSFDTSKVKEMQYMFMGCFSLKEINLSSFNTINVINMSNMFHGCVSLKFLDLSSFKTPNLTTIDLMFTGCEQLESIDLSSFTTINVKLGNEMLNNLKYFGDQIIQMFNSLQFTFQNIFLGCKSLKNIKCKDKLILDMFKEIENQN